ncbi:T9SS type A sorting domain-containing protein [Flavobacterium silvisoli]|uniref:T9SS type A sorting domain-containing protein n=1 Tax=Flavobacterium silvisoli TaxID=2529433 RepID=A0A4Q9Z0A3_9FLAO|nr:peptidoglycan DD-metalloendopeptidase family protein [Flavobacterium silvisoli]TBX69514.1 T9SS type A sorting domain-containing protein [Flavobacterium silvisoli]
MKNISKILKTIGIIFLFLASISLYSQTNKKDFQVDGGNYPFPKNDAQHPCISIEEYEVLNKEVGENLRKLHLEDRVNRNSLTTSLNWPLQTASGFTQCSYHFIGAYVDQNTATTAIQDYDCGTNTYDGHHGTDIAIWPYSFYKMDNNQIEVVAAAAGTIIQKADGNFDRNCSSNTLTANSIIIQHADGTYALYWHMKKNSVTTKNVGQTVAAGEYLGIVGSSGSASGPHLHFEIWSGNTNTTYKDPYSGSCNLLNVNSWWASQKPHTDPAIMKVSVNTTDNIMPGCPTTETPNESDVYVIPFQGDGLPAGYAKFYVFLREIPANSLLTMRILNPNGTAFSSWTYTVPTLNKISYWGFSKLLPTTDGNYIFDATYNGQTCSKSFTITHSLGINDVTTADSFNIFPNPTSDEFSLSVYSLESKTYTYCLSNITGQIIETDKITINNHKWEKSFLISSLSKGIYFLTLNDSNSQIVKKIIKN